MITIVLCGIPVIFMVLYWLLMKRIDRDNSFYTDHFNNFIKEVEYMSAGTYHRQVAVNVNPKLIEKEKIHEHLDELQDIWDSLANSTTDIDSLANMEDTWIAATKSGNLKSEFVALRKKFNAMTKAIITRVHGGLGTKTTQINYHEMQIRYNEEKFIEIKYFGELVYFGNVKYDQLLFIRFGDWIVYFKKLCMISIGFGPVKKQILETIANKEKVKADLSTLPVMVK
jgi:hypothetical protein